MKNKFKQIVVGCQQSREYNKTGKCHYDQGGFRFMIEKGEDNEPHIVSIIASPEKWANTEFEIVVRK